MALGGTDYVLISGIFSLAFALVKVLDRMIDKALSDRKNGNGSKAPIVDNCGDCRKTVTETHFAIRTLSDKQDTGNGLLRDIRDGVRDLNRPPHPHAGRGASGSRL